MFCAREEEKKQNASSDPLARQRARRVNATLMKWFVPLENDSHVEIRVTIMRLKNAPREAAWVIPEG